MHSPARRLDAGLLASLGIAALSWVFPNLPLTVKASVSILIIGLVVVANLLPEEGRGLQLFLHVLAGAVAGLAFGFMVANDSFRDPVYGPENVGGLPLWLPTGETVINTTGYVVSAGCLAVGAFLGLYAKFSQFSAGKIPGMAHKARLFILLSVVGVGGAVAASRGYINQGKNAAEIEESGGKLANAQTQGSDRVMWRDIATFARQRLQLDTLIVEGGIVLFGSSLLGATILAAYWLSVGDPAPSRPESYDAA